MGDVHCTSDRVARPHKSQYSLLQPPFRRPHVPSFLPRDRYRAQRHSTASAHDIVDDDMYAEDVQFDEFDQELLQQPYEDRQRQAAQGKARLSLAPKPSDSLASVASSQSQHPIRTKTHSDDYRHHSWQPSQIAGNRTQFMYAQQSSPDAQMDASSSPAFMAGKRRAAGSQLILPRKAEDLDVEGGYSLRGINRSATTWDPVRPYASKEGRVMSQHSRQETIRSRPPILPPEPAVDLNILPRAPPIIQGVQIVPVTILPDRLRTIFSFPNFNVVQSKCFDDVYKSDNNFVLASPTGSGKTAILELAICRAVATNATGQYKIVYQAPIKALCSERQQDWQNRLGQIGLNCVELTGDSDASDLRGVQSANIIITTPEKWDSITRKWKDHEKLMRLIKLFLIDEVHILKEDRGATLESMGTDVRFVALSATVPNFRDVATWLGKNAAEPDEPAISEKFGEEHRPVKLKKYVCGYASVANDFAFEKVLNDNITNVIAKYSERKPIMIFCTTRASTSNTAKRLANWWASSNDHDRVWNSPSKPMQLQSRELREVVQSGVAFHHAGVDSEDRKVIERGFLDGDIGVICCTQTLAVGVNLPCHLVIIKNTVFWNSNSTQEYSDLEVMQMIGRAGRPQFDKTAVAVIMTRQSKTRRYETMVSGEEVLESQLHLNFISHMNAEIALGTIHDRASARTWLTGTFLYVRLQQNPGYYKLEGSKGIQNVDEQVEEICSRDINILRENDLITGDDRLRCTDLGQAMARYYVHFETMRLFIGLKPKAHLSEILSAIAQASEFEAIRFRVGEKSFFKALNNSLAIRFPIQVDLALPAQKVSLLIQSALGAADLPLDKDGRYHRNQYNMDLNIVFKHINRLIRCIIDCEIMRQDSVSAGHALMLGRSLGARVWDDSPMTMKQIEGIGPVGVRKLVNSNIRSIEELELSEAHKIERALGKNPPFGMRVLSKLKELPKLRVSLQALTDSIVRTSEGVTIYVKADVGFLNERPPQAFGNKPVYICVLVETSDGRMIRFARFSGSAMSKGQILTFPALLTSADQHVNCYISCDQIAGTMRGATVRPRVPPFMFPTSTPLKPSTKSTKISKPTSNMGRRRSDSVDNLKEATADTDEFGDEGIDDEELMQASSHDIEFDHIENYANPLDSLTRMNTARNSGKKGKIMTKAIETMHEEESNEPRQLKNGKWACNHKCKDKSMCKHLCCREGLEKPPKKSTAKRTLAEDISARVLPNNKSERDQKVQTKLQMKASKRRSSTDIEQLDLTQREKKKKLGHCMNGPEFHELHKLHQAVQKKGPPTSFSSIIHKKPAYHCSQGGAYKLSFLDDDMSAERPGTTNSSDYGDVRLDDFEQENYDDIRQNTGMLRDMRLDYTRPLSTEEPPPSRLSDTFDDDDSLLGDIMVGLADSQDLAMTNMVGVGDEDLRFVEESFDADSGPDLADPRSEGSMEITPDMSQFQGPEEYSTLLTVKTPILVPQKEASLFYNDTSISSPGLKLDGFRSAKSMLNGDELKELTQYKPDSSKHDQESVIEEQEMDIDGFDLVDFSEIEKNEPHEIKEHIPDSWKDLESWVLKEFGNIIELADNVE